MSKKLAFPVSWGKKCVLPTPGRVTLSNFWNFLDGTSVPEQNFMSLPPAHIKPSVEMPPLNHVCELAPLTRKQWAIFSSVISYVPYLQYQM